MPAIFNRPPKLFKCIGQLVYVLTDANDFYKIDTSSKLVTKQEGDDIHNFAGSGYDFTLILKDKNVYAKGANQYG